ncbi:MAG: lipase family protein, partial [Rhodocyclaceae bacterium]
MATQFEVNCALMAGRAYQTNRNSNNWFPIPDGWTEFFHVPNGTYPTTMGFEAVSFVRDGNPNEIVISFAGTDGLLSADQFANFGLTTGLGAEQLLQAADYYLAVKVQNPGATITFTGHSLGGGLAALMGVFFDCKAVTFDPAPFAASARGTILGTDVATDAQQQLYTRVGGGINFDRGDIADSLGDIKGYNLYFQPWLATLPETEKTLIEQKLAGLLDWYLTGTRLIATAGTQAAFMLGAGNTDSLTGGAQADLLVGLGGIDILMGGLGKDVLMGGAGLDTYLYKIGDGADRIIDADKQGRILVAAADGNRFYDTTHLIQDKDNSNLWSNADGQVRLTGGSTWQLQIGGGSIDLGDSFSAGDYGIRLKNAPTQITPTGQSHQTEPSPRRASRKESEEAARIRRVWMPPLRLDGSRRNK